MAARAGVAKKASQGVAAVALASALTLGAVDAAQADISGLEPCSTSKAFNKTRKSEIKKLEKRKKLVRSPESPAHENLLGPESAAMPVIGCRMCSSYLWLGQRPARWAGPHPAVTTWQG